MTDEVRKKVIDLFENTSMTLVEIAKEVGYESYTYIYRECISGRYTKEFLYQRKRLNYQAARERDGDPMQGKCGVLSPRYKGDISDGHGYIMVLKPDWYTGRKKSRHVFKHSVVMCEALGLTEIPEGFVVHHIDGDKTNNNINNLALLSAGAHRRLHHLYEGAETISKESRNLGSEAHPNYRREEVVDDIVHFDEHAEYSSQQ